MSDGEPPFAVDSTHTGELSLVYGRDESRKHLVDTSSKYLVFDRRQRVFTRA